jgi:hypothetical protein
MRDCIQSEIMPPHINAIIAIIATTITVEPSITSLRLPIPPTPLILPTHTPGQHRLRTASVYA